MNELGILLFVVITGTIVWLLYRRGVTSAKYTSGRAQLVELLVAWNDRDDTLNTRQRTIALVLVSVLGLYFELVLIRLLGSEIKVFAFLKNVVLIGAFLGLGMGFFLSRQRIGLLPLFLPGATLLVASVVLSGATGLLTHTVLPGGDELVLLGVSFTKLQPVSSLLRILTWIPYYAITLLYFLFVVIIFIPLGQYTGKCMRAFSPIPSYTFNLAGSLAGTLLFALVSFLWAPPLVWFLLVVFLAVPVIRASSGWLRWINLVSALILIAVQGLPGSTVWSPYNKLVVSPFMGQDSNGQTFQWGYQLGVGEYYYQDLLDLSDIFFDEHKDLPLEYRYSEYEVPYAFIQPETVLILGAGTGNDVSAALRRGAQQVDAVDIDPGIIDFGKRLHPEQPYANDKVTPHTNDARAFLKSSQDQYDLVLFGLLDSQQVLSAFGSVRLDNFVYTVEGMQDAFARVKPDGLLVVTFELFEPWMGERIARVIQQASGQSPVVLSAHHGTAFIVRNGTPLSESEIDQALSKLGGVVKPLSLDSTGIALTTDNWPYLYMRERTIPFAYWTMLPLLALASIVLSRRVLGTGWNIQWSFFFLGAAFMLMEVRIIAQVALLFGSTWVVNAAAITAVLVMATLSNLLIARLQVDNVRLWGILLLVTLAVSSLIPVTTFLSLGQNIGGMLAALVLALPIFFAGMVFSGSLKQTQSVDTAMASNLLGAILGGFVEYLTLLLGIGSLAWIAFLFYAIALIADKLRTSKA